MIAAVALANKMGRGLRAMMTKHEDDRKPAATMASRRLRVSAFPYVGNVRRSLNNKGEG